LAHLPGQSGKGGEVEQQRCGQIHPVLGGNGIPQLNGTEEIQPRLKPCRWCCSFCYARKQNLHTCVCGERERQIEREREREGDGERKMTEGQREYISWQIHPKLGGIGILKLNASKGIQRGLKMATSDC
jgi:hypothetical protein